MSPTPKHKVRPSTVTAATMRFCVVRIEGAITRTVSCHRFADDAEEVRSALDAVAALGGLPNEQRKR